MLIFYLKEIIIIIKLEKFIDDLNFEAFKNDITSYSSFNNETNNLSFNSIIIINNLNQYHIEIEGDIQIYNYYFHFIGKEIYGKITINNNITLDLSKKIIF